ncbi:MAG: hypothetical protein HOM68_28105 [Gemmatimonadetes bacterium]|jgi:hypothetical protein|nr:hypothetical protein [Gemmatimonadota bacterium]MBT4609941.1 hypothetical protein [Gemmatimonadota bacterium]MBT5060440.1 hypothetical protein [Gemmatimonadota bacterium]MBT5142414.1 hypothetical protein [Gemmatimonadota bacterium]MBT5588208.1 hypothetical protein [Gemmatimonadota bacterium]
MQRTMAAMAVLALVACSVTLPQIKYNSTLAASAVPIADVEGNETGAVYSIEGLRVQVEPLTDERLNALFPGDSKRDRFSTNPYTYGDWVNPLVGYTPVRFTVFKVSITNDIYAKVLLDPLQAVLHTDRGEVLNSYGIPSWSPHNSFERYYRALRGQSGNEFYRFDLRMGNVRSSAYLEDQRVFKGESYSGLIAFDPLPEDVTQVRLVLQDFVLRFDASGQPLEAVDITMDFDRTLEVSEVQVATGAQE